MAVFVACRNFGSPPGSQSEVRRESGESKERGPNLLRGKTDVNLEAIYTT